MTDAPYPNAALTDVCRQLVDDYGLTLEQITNLAADLPTEAEAHLAERTSGRAADMLSALNRIATYTGESPGAYMRTVAEAAIIRAKKP